MPWIYYSDFATLTHLRSPNKAKEKVPGFLDAGHLSFGLNYRMSLMAEEADVAIRQGNGS